MRRRFACTHEPETVHECGRLPSYPADGRLAAGRDLRPGGPAEPGMGRAHSFLNFSGTRGQGRLSLGPGRRGAGDDGLSGVYRPGDFSYPG